MFFLQKNIFFELVFTFFLFVLVDKLFIVVYRCNKQNPVLSIFASIYNFFYTSADYAAWTTELEYIPL